MIAENRPERHLLLRPDRLNSLTSRCHRSVTRLPGWFVPRPLPPRLETALAVPVARTCGVATVGTMDVEEFGRSVAIVQATIQTVRPSTTVDGHPTPMMTPFFCFFFFFFYTLFFFLFFFFFLFASLFCFIAFIFAPCITFFFYL